MSKYYNADDVTELINACEWRMTLAKERHGEGFVDYSKQVLDVDELTKRLSDLPTIEVSEEQLSKLKSRENSVENTTASEDFTSISRAKSKFYELMDRTHNCNDCGNIDYCGIAPDYGERVRYNCYLWKEKRGVE